MTYHAYGRKCYRGVPCPPERVGLYPDKNFREARHFIGRFDARVVCRGEKILGIVNDDYARGEWLRTIRANDWSDDIEQWAHTVADELGWKQ